MAEDEEESDDIADYYGGLRRKGVMRQGEAEGAEGSRGGQGEVQPGSAYA